MFSKISDAFFYIIRKRISKDQIEQKYNQIFNSKLDGKKELKLVVDRVSKVYNNGIKALDNLSLEIKHGEFVVFLGPSGCGKTTLLRMIVGLEKISDGYIRMNNAIINALQPKDRNVAMVFQNYALYPFMTVFDNIKFGLRNKSANNFVYDKASHEVKLAKNPNYDEIIKIKAKMSIIKKGSSKQMDELLAAKREVKVAKIKKDKLLVRKCKDNLVQKMNQKKQMTTSKEVKNNIALLKTKMAKLKKEGIQNKKSTQEIKSLINKRHETYNVWKMAIPLRIEKTLQLLGIDAYANRKPGELSGGQRQRVALARAISKQTNLFLYDEPLSNLDAKLRVKMRSKIRKLHEMLGSTSIYVTHDQIEAMSMADKIVVMNKGYIQQIGEPRELIDKPNNLFVSKFIGNTDINIFDAKYFKKNKMIVNQIHIELAASQKLASIDWETISSLKLVIRPEHIITDKQLLNHIKSNKHRAKIIQTEFLGNEILAILDVPKLGHLNAIFSNSSNVKKGENVEFAINPNKVLLFEGKYGFNMLKKLDYYNSLSKNVWINGKEERDKNTFILYKEKNKLTKFKKFFYLILSIFSQNAKEKIQLAIGSPEVSKSLVAD